MQYQVSGEVFPIVEIQLNNGDSVFTESGGMAWMSEGIAMATSTRGGLMAGLGRALAGESLFMVSYRCEAQSGSVVFTPEAPGRILDMSLAPGQSLICQKDTFLCAEESVELKMHFHKRLGAGLFGGEGFILQKVTGPGTAFFAIPGEVQERTLGSGEKLLIDPGHIAMFEPTVDYEINMVRGIKNVLFAGEGLFLATLTGPGKVWLETMPLANLAAKIARYFPKKG
ncbi:MAG: TIGR00266 family protein [Brevefilum sp.]